MILTHAQYMERFNKTDPDKSPFQRHLDVCGIKTKNDKRNRARKFLWGIKMGKDTTWTSLCHITPKHLENIKGYLANYKHSFEDEQIGWVFDLVDYTIENYDSVFKEAVDAL